MDNIRKIIDNITTSQDEDTVKTNCYQLLQLMSDYGIAKSIQDEFHDLIKDNLMDNKTKISLMIQTVILPLIKKRGGKKVPPKGKRAWDKKK